MTVPADTGQSEPMVRRKPGWRALEPVRWRTGLAGARGMKEDNPVRSMLLWLIGVPIPLILLLAFCTHHF